MARKILCVAEKPSIAKAVAQHLSGGSVNAVSQGNSRGGCGMLMPIKHSINGNQYVKNYDFDFSFSPPWGNCSVTMTSVIGHLNDLEFPQQYRKWHSCPPAHLFDAPVETIAYPVSKISSHFMHSSRDCRTRNALQTI